MKRYSRKFKEASYDRVYTNFEKTDLYKHGYSLGQIINPLFQALRTYERDGNIQSLFPFKKFVGLGDVLFSPKKYTLYKGLFLTKNQGYIHSGDFEKISKTKKFRIQKSVSSWTTSLSVAKRFARGSTHWMDTPKLDKEYYQNGEYFGIVLEYRPSINEILVDFNFIEDEGMWTAGFSEDEVILIPKTQIFKVEEIIEK